MFASIILVLPFLAVALLPIAMKSLFSSEELNDMGICLEEPATTASVDFMNQQDYIVCNTPILYGHV